MTDGQKRGMMKPRMDVMDYYEFTPEQLLGPLNAVEQKNAPQRLFVAGDVDILNHGARVSIVGSRNASPAGLARARKLARILVDQGIVVVSGLAAGIDTAAHTTAIASGGKTIAVIGTPLDRTYPKENAALQEKIMQEHLCISQFAPADKTGRHSFPMRNRTMALLSDATVIIEAGERSGTLHQAWEALRLGRGLFISKAVAEQSLSWLDEIFGYGAQVLSDDTLSQFLEFLPNRTPARAHGELAF